MTAAALRVIDSGVRGARENLALTAAIAALHREGQCPDTLRFQHFRASAIIGRHQVLADEVHLDEALIRGVDTARRQTGGGAIYMAPGMLGFELIVSRGLFSGGLDDITARLCTALAGGLSRLGIDARFRPRNDVEVEGRKISGTGGFIDGRTLVFQGTVLMDYDVADMAAVLKLPVGKLDRKGLAALAQRVTSLRELLGAAPPVGEVEAVVAAAFADELSLAAAWHSAPTTAEEELAARKHAEEIGQDAFVVGEEPQRHGVDVAASMVTPGGRVSAAARLSPGAERRIARVWITGDIFLTPTRALNDLEAALCACPLADAPAATAAFLRARQVDMLGLRPDDLVRLVSDLASGAGATEAQTTEAKTARA